MYVVLPLFGVAVRGNATLTMACIGYSVLWNTEERCDIGVSLDMFNRNKCNFCYPFLLLLEILPGVKASLILLLLVIPYWGTLMYDMILV